MSRRNLFQDISNEQFDLWSDLNRRINEGKVIPLIGNALVNNAIFDFDHDAQIGISQNTDLSNEAYQFRIDEQLAQEWADFLQYPLAESPLQLTRVAQYNQVLCDDNEVAKVNYLTFLKLYLLQLALDDRAVSDVAEQLLEPLLNPTTGKLRPFPSLVNRLADQSFAELAFQLGYPRYADVSQDPVYLLAQLPLPVYVTTSHHDFLERALVEAEKYPRVQVCSWFGDHPDVTWFGDHPTDPKINLTTPPSERLPIVYHLFGLEKDPSTLVISEDDYIEFLVRISEDRNNLPLGLRKALRHASLLMLGYRLRGWDFRALFRSLIKTRESDQANLAIQLNPHVHPADDDQPVDEHMTEAQRYLEKYLEPAKFKVEWDTAGRFIQKLLQSWKENAQ